MAPCRPRAPLRLSQAVSCTVLAAGRGRSQPPPTRGPRGAFVSPRPARVFVSSSLQVLVTVSATSHVIIPVPGTRDEVRRVPVCGHDGRHVAACAAIAARLVPYWPGREARCTAGRCPVPATWRPLGERTANSVAGRPRHGRRACPLVAQGATEHVVHLPAHRAHPRPPEGPDVPRRRPVCRDLPAGRVLAYPPTRVRSEFPKIGALWPHVGHGPAGAVHSRNRHVPGPTQARRDPGPRPGSRASRRGDIILGHPDRRDVELVNPTGGCGPPSSDPDRMLARTSKTG